MSDSATVPLSPPKRRPVLVDFVLRCDSALKFGGDSLQVQAYCDHLIGNGFDCRQVPIAPLLKPRDGAAVHVVNIDRPYDFLLAVRRVPSGLLFVSPIHHDLAYVSKMRRAGSGTGLRHVVEKVLGEAAREWLAFGIRNLRLAKGARDRCAALWSWLVAFASVPNVWRQVGRELDRAQAVFLLASGEGNSIVRDTGCVGRNFVLAPNGLPPSRRTAANRPWVNREIPILVVGRIEPRKRQLEVARAAKRLNIPVKFVGAVNANDSMYAKDMAAVIEGTSGLSWDGAVPHGDVVELMANSKVLLNASWVEVQSLVDLEAASQGCFVVANAGGNSKEWLPEHVFFPDAETVEDALEMAWKLANAEAGPPPCEYAWTWEKAAAVLAENYPAAR